MDELLEEFLTETVERLDELDAISCALCCRVGAA